MMGLGATAPGEGVARNKVRAQGMSKIALGFHRNFGLRVFC